MLALGCTASYSCASLGQGRGVVGHVTDSCIANESCHNTGFNWGSIGSNSTSCKADSVCKDAGSGSTGTISSNLQGCCNSANACKSATEATLPKQCNSKVRDCNVPVLKPACVQCRATHILWFNVSTHISVSKEVCKSCLKVNEVSTLHSQMLGAKAMNDQQEIWNKCKNVA